MGWDTYKNHRRILPSVGMIADVKNVLNASTSSLKELCRSPKINRWAKYKPVIKNKQATYDERNSDNTWKSNATWWKGTDGQCGINVLTQTSFLTMCRTWVSSGWEAFWQYSPPTGGASAPYRLADFDYYLHKNTMNPDYDKPYHSWSCGGLPTETEQEVYVYPDDYGDIDGNCYTSVFGAIYKNTHYNDYLLKLSDITIRRGNDVVNMGDTFFGVVIAKDLDGNSPQFSLITSPYNWNANVPSQNPYDMPAGTDLRFTPQMHYVAFSGLGTYLAFPVCVKTSNATGYSQWASYNICKMSTNNTGLSGQEYMIPLPMAPKTLNLQRASLIWGISVSVNHTTANNVYWDIVITNITDGGAYLPISAILYDNTSYPKTSSGSTDYSNPLEQSKMHYNQSGGSVYIGSGQSYTISGSGSNGFNTTTRNDGYGYYSMIKVYGNAQFDHAFLGVDYP